MRDDSVCAPEAVIETAVVVCGVPPSSFHSTPATPEVASDPAITVVKFVFCQPPAGTAVVLEGLVRSILTVSPRQPDELPALSTTCVSSSCTPSASTTAGEPV